MSLIRSTAYCSFSRAVRQQPLGSGESVCIFARYGGFFRLYEYGEMDEMKLRETVRCVI